MKTQKPPIAHLFHGTTEALHLGLRPILEPQLPRHEPDKPQEALVYLTPRFRMAEIYALKGRLDSRSKPVSIGHFPQADGSIIDTAIFLDPPSDDLEGGWVYQFPVTAIPRFEEMINKGKPSGEYTTKYNLDLTKATAIKGRSLYEQMRVCDLQILYIAPGRDPIEDYYKVVDAILKAGHSIHYAKATMLESGVLRSLNEEMNLPYIAFKGDEATLVTPPLIGSHEIPPSCSHSVLQR